MSARTCAVFVLVTLIGVSSSSQNAPDTHAVTVSQGTSMAVAVSPDGTRLVIDLQGSLTGARHVIGRSTSPIPGGSRQMASSSMQDA